MARAVLVCGRQTSIMPDAARVADLLVRRLVPDNIDARTPTLAAEDRVLVLVLDLPTPADLTGTSVCLGATTERAADWMQPGAALPEGSFALWRVASNRIELAADTCASRTLWYVLTENLFLVSTSQRAITLLLGEFRPSRVAYSWMISSGTLGPGFGWDARVRAVPAGGRVVLDRRRWRLEETRAEAAFAADTASHVPDRRAKLLHTVESTVARQRLADAGWAITLSGGVDSRGLLLALLSSGAAPSSVRCLSWGRSSTIQEPDHDAFVAKQLATRTGTDFRFFATDLETTPPVERLIERFLVAGEGRAARISGYLDGFAIWKHIREEGLRGIIRGDHVFGRSGAHTATQARAVAHLTLLDDYFDGRELAGLELPPQRLPGELERGQRETLATWRDRLSQQFSVPVMLAALTDLKCAYVEVANPLLAEPVVRYARTLTDRERTGKSLWRQTVREALPDMPFAKHVSIVALANFLTTRAMLTLMADELGSSRARDCLGPGLVGLARGAVTARLERDHARAPRAVPGTHLVTRAVALARRRLGLSTLTLHPLVLAFRAYLIVRMNDLLAADAAALQRGEGAAVGVTEPRGVASAHP